MSQKPGYSDPPTSSIRKLAAIITRSKIYHTFFVIALLSNLINLSMWYHNASDSYLQIINKLY